MAARLNLLLRYFGYWLAFFIAVRMVFLVFHAGQSAALPAPVLAGTLWHGLRLDLSAAAYLSLIPFLLIAGSVFPRLGRWTARLLLGYTAITTTALSLLAAADLEAFRSWGRRIDASVLAYLAFPREIWAAAGGGNPWLLLALWVLLSAGFTLLAWRLLQPRFVALPPAHPLQRGRCQTLATYGDPASP